MLKNIKNKKSFNYFYINQMSYNNLSQYDYNFLKNLKTEIPSIEILYLCSSLNEVNKELPIRKTKVFEYNRIKNKLLKLISYIFSNCKIIIYLFINQPKFVHYQWIKINYIDFFTILLIKIFLKSTIIFTVHNAKNRDRNPFNLLLQKKIFLCFDWLIFHTISCKNEVLKLRLKKKYKFFILTHGTLNIANNLLIPEKLDLKDLSCLKEYINKFKKKFIFIGKGTYYKGIDIVLDAWEKFCTLNNKEACLLIIGKLDNKVHAKYRKLLQEENIFLVNKNISNFFLDEAVKLSDYILLPHRFISFSGIYASFLKLRKPFLYSITSENNMLDYKEFKETGFGFKPNPKSLFEIFLCLIKNEENFLIQSKKWDAALSFFSWEESFLRSEFIENIYEELPKRI